MVRIILNNIEEILIEISNYLNNKQDIYDIGA